MQCWYGFGKIDTLTLYIVDLCDLLQISFQEINPAVLIKVKNTHAFWFSGSTFGKLANKTMTVSGHNNIWTVYCYIVCIAKN